MSPPHPAPCERQSVSVLLYANHMLTAAFGPMLCPNNVFRECLGPAAGLEVYTGPLAGGKHTAVLFNRSPTVANITLDFASLWTTPAELAAVWQGRGSEQIRATWAASALSVRDVWAHRDLGQFTGSFTAEVRPHAVAHLVLSQP